MSIGNSVYSIILEWQQSDDYLPPSMVLIPAVSLSGVCWLSLLHGKINLCPSWQTFSFKQ
jgi:hypothetical protein